MMPQVVTFLVLVAAVELQARLPLGSEKPYDIYIDFFRPVEGSPTDVDYGALEMKRFNRTTHVVTGKMTFNLEINQDITVNLRSYQKKGDDYQESFLKFDNESLCHTIETDTFIYPSVLKASENLPAKCPIPAGTYEINNFVVDMRRLPSSIPQGTWLLIADTNRGEQLLSTIEIGARIVLKTNA